MLFSKSFFALAAAASMVAASPASRAADGTVTCTVAVTTTPALPSFVGTIVAGLADTAIEAALPGAGTVTTSSTVTKSGNTFTYTITVTVPHVPDATLIHDLDGETLGPITATVLGETVSLEVAVSDCS